MHPYFGFFQEIYRLANTAQARKRARQAETHRLLNASQRSTLRTHVKQLLKTIAGGDKAKAQEIYKTTVSVIDKAATKGLIHENKAARHKSRLNNRVRAMG